MPAIDERFFRTRPDGRVQCTLCPHYCRIPEGGMGFCYIHQNHKGRMVNVAYGKPTAVAVDPIEKKPLFHFLPGSTILSIGTAGCNMGCKFCQNWDISKARADQVRSIRLPPQAAVDLAVREGCPSIAYTYNEPIVFAEYLMDIAVLARSAGLKNVMVSNGYITDEALPYVFENIDAANIDLKAFDDHFYRKYTLSQIKPVLNTLVKLKEMGVWVEITTLLIPGLNTDPDMIRKESRWILQNMGDETPVHFSAFYPTYKMLDRPRTRAKTLLDARRIALDVGLKYVYVGNVLSEGGNTYCPGCGRLLIERSWHTVTKYNIGTDHKCTCGETIPIIG